MSDCYQEFLDKIRRRPRRWLVTGAAGFIGGHLTEELLRNGQEVRGLDDFSTGKRANLDDVRARVGEEAWARFEFREADIADLEACRAACAGVGHVLHQAALGSVPRSLEEPHATLRANVQGFGNVLVAAQEAGVASLVYASSSSVYGDHPALPKVEDQTGEPLSPYAASKLADEVLAAVFARSFGMRLTGLRYFNVFGPRQDPDGAYAAVIPRWLALLARGESGTIFGDGKTSRDFCPVANVVQANLLSAARDAGDDHAVYNIALGGRTDLRELYAALQAGMATRGAPCEEAGPLDGPFRAGDVRHSLASIDRAVEEIGFSPGVGFLEGLDRTMDWFAESLGLSGGNR